ncbi:MAG TPA: hypothetical protein PLP22_13740 [Candidatus Competibacter sp.]|nr:hypothetical protein [Candidatus Competibacteraceae bacterium]HRE55837.1 hypothetical protein [Candidatus Competibacter sp.]HUM93250.1 hypothetical protein [Candidatus Competibacter sp.]
MSPEEIANLTLEHLRRFNQKQDRTLQLIEDLRDRVSSLEIQSSGIGRELAGLRGDFARLEHRVDRMDQRLDRIERRLDLTDAPH